MPAVYWKTSVGLGFALAAALVCRALPGPASGSRAIGNSQTPPPPAKLAPNYASVKNCSDSGCHKETKPQRDVNGDPYVCLCTEVNAWEQEDKHSKAFRVLEGTRAKAMAKLLRYEKDDPTKVQACLSCHAGVLEDHAQVRKGAIVEEGVSCVICHGPTGEWITAHAGVVKQPKERPKWRGKSRADKAKLGMIDLWDGRTRAQVCSACHIGNAKEGKFITHAMYAAGHPPLPSIEFAAFSEEMPRHWQYLREKDDAILTALLKDVELEDRRRLMAKFERTQLTVIGGAVALRVSLDLLAAKAKECVDAKDAGKQALDYALFDCAACHHELKNPGWRQARGYRGLKPGRPPPPLWPTTLARIGVRHLGQDEKELDERLARLAEAFSTRPFGDPTKVAEAAKAWAGRTQMLIDDLDNRKFGEGAAKELRSLMMDFKADAYPDYDSARQRAWAFFMVTQELAWKKESNEINAKELYRNQLKKFSKRLDGTLLLSLPSDKDPLYDEQLADQLKAMSNYDPSHFKRAFSALEKSPPN